MVRNLASGIAIAALASLPFATNAQGTVDIGLYQHNGNLEVKVRPTSEFDGVFSSVVFTLRWDKSTGITLGEAVVPEGTPIRTTRSGQTHEEGVFNYLVFAGFGFDVMSASGQRYEAGKEYPRARQRRGGTGERYVDQRAHQQRRLLRIAGRV